MTAHGITRTSEHTSSHAGQAPVSEFGVKSDAGGWLRVLVTVERIRSRWAVVQTAHFTRSGQWGGTFWNAGDRQSRTVVVQGVPTKAAAIARATGARA